jgi:hypothetical protein
MMLVRLDIRNFRLLWDVSIRMDETQTTTIRRDRPGFQRKRARAIL